MSLENCSSFRDRLSDRHSCEVFEYLVFFMGVSEVPSFTREILGKSEFQNSKMKGRLQFWPQTRINRNFKKIGTWMSSEILEVSRDGLSHRHCCYLSN
jgi:hypothetical protein